MIFLTASAFKTDGHQKFTEIDVERINVVEKDGTVKMIITNVNKFPSGKEKVNGSAPNKTRKNVQECSFLMKKELNAVALSMTGRRIKTDTVPDCL
ncbi:hypothetical protein DRF65_18615 [Chryseobacterium pennae]|uniref:Uncharacterized protein n=1 Tax=Chryseobacterium pennae TaxID=2258962 RepID=A0A3D9C4Z6_9FLAO|nr:hypothetical protein [Chryseobacterium pennae]REC60819.1 hypothetical protein DRF65_18615 [Chryseobacterium pennae]